jgi:hypothetical protein
MRGMESTTECDGDVHNHIYNHDKPAIWKPIRGMESTTECDGDVHNHATGVYSTAGTANRYI